MALPPETSASAAVAAIFFVLTAFSPLNFKLTGKGFHLYIPIGISAAFRGVAHACRASFFVTHNVDLMAPYGALNAAGFGIAVAMCCCFMVIWLRNAAHYQSPTAAKSLALGGRLLVACVIAFGPVLGVIAAIVVYGSKPGDLSAKEHGLHIRVASSAGFTAVTALASLVAIYLALSWLISSRKAAKGASTIPPAPAAEAGDTPQAPPQQQQQQDGLIFLLAGCLLLLCWSAATRLAQYDHPILQSSTVLYHTVSIIPELVVATIFAVPTLAARMALGGRYAVWLKGQRDKKRGGSNGSSGSNGSLADAEVGVDGSGVQLGKK